MADLKTQIEGLQSALRELAEFNAAPVDPIDPSVARPGAYFSYHSRSRISVTDNCNPSCAFRTDSNASASSYGMRRKYRFELPRATKSSSTAPAPAKTPEVQLTTPPATPSRGETALFDSAGAGRGLGTGMSAAFALPAASTQLGLEPASGPTRAGSWHGRVRRNGGRRAGARAVLQTLVARDAIDDSDDDDYDDDEDEDENISLSGGRCQVRSSPPNQYFASSFLTNTSSFAQIKRRAGSMDLKSISSAWGVGVGPISQPRPNPFRRGLGLTT